MLLKDHLIAHYKMNENTAGDNAELVTNGDFAAWTADNPDGWSVVGESGDDPEVSEAATGEAHADTPTPGGGMCNIFTSDGTSIYMTTVVVLIPGRRYKFSINIDTVTTGAIRVYDGTLSMIPYQLYSTTGIKTYYFVANASSMTLAIIRNPDLGGADVTFDDVSIKLCAIEDSSGNDHDALAQQDSDAISVPGKINTALEFNGSSDYVLIPDSDDFTPALTPFSISAWVNMDDATNFRIASKGVYNTDGEWDLHVSASNFLFFYLYDESVFNCFIRRYDTVTFLTAYENQWIHIVATYNGNASHTGLKLYLNGVRTDEAGSTQGSFVSVENLAHDVWIGRYGDIYANGSIDNVMFFNKELTPLEVQLLYNSGAGVETIPIGIHLSRTGQQFSSSPMN